MGGGIGGNWCSKVEVPGSICENIYPVIPFRIDVVATSAVSLHPARHPCGRSPLCITGGSNKEQLSHSPFEGAGQIR